MAHWQELLNGLNAGDIRSLARCISLVENNAAGYHELLRNLRTSDTPVIGITGPPGAGKSTLVDSLIACLTDAGKKVAILCVDPSSPFNMGAILGDRIRMSNWYLNPYVYIRSLASRGALGGLHPKIIEITDVTKAAGFDYIIVETVGVGQSEVEIAGLADVSVVVVVPEAGDEVQTMKAGLMEIADVFVVNKADRPGADSFIKYLRLMLAPAFSKKQHEIPVIKTVATTREGIDVLFEKITAFLESASFNEKKYWLLADKAYQLLQQKRMAGMDRYKLHDRIKAAADVGNFNLYEWVDEIG